MKQEIQKRKLEENKANPQHIWKNLIETKSRKEEIISIKDRHNKLIIYEYADHFNGSGEEFVEKIEKSMTEIPR